MSEKTVFIEIFQPFAQYRNPFTFYYAQTFPLPPKSTIIGMLQNACNDWYGNKYRAENWFNLKVSIHGGFESFFWNYQSLIKGEIEIKNMKLYNQGLPLYGEGITSQRTPVYQQELFNGHLFIFIKGEENIIEKIKESLEIPQKVLYLGRSEDVIFINKVEEVVHTKTKVVRKNLWLLYPTYIKIKDFPIKNEKYPVYSIPVKVIFENNGNPIKTKIEITKSTERKTEFESVIYTGYDYIVHLKDGEEIKVEEYNLKDHKGNDLLFKIPVNFGWL